MAAHHVDLKSYTVNLVFAVEGVGELIVFESYFLPGTVHEEISGREVFLFNADGTAIWQIDPETGTTENRLHDFDRSIETTEPFVNVWDAYGEYYASRINGDSFRLDLASGLATYSGWART
jgi:hypothetical protein